MTQKIALITGVTGQDGAYLSEYLLKKGYIVIKALDSVVVVFQGIRYFPTAWAMQAICVIPTCLANHS